MARLNWHGHARCHDCDWRFDEADTTHALDFDGEARRHERQTGHATVTGLHRRDYCGTLGCPPPETAVQEGP